MRVPAPPSRIEFAGHRIAGVRLADCLDVDQSNELSARLFGSARMRRLRAGGAFHFTHDHVPFGAISFDRMSWGAHTSLVPKAEALPGYYLVTLPIRGAARVRQDSHVQPLAPGTCGVFGPLRSFEIEAANAETTVPDYKHDLFSGSRKLSTDGHADAVANGR